MNKLTSYLNTNKDTKEIIWKFAFLGNATIQATKYDELSELAEHENWTSSGSSKKIIFYKAISLIHLIGLLNWGKNMF